MLYLAKKNGKPKFDYPSKYHYNFKIILDFDPNSAIFDIGKKSMCLTINGLDILNRFLWEYRFVVKVFTEIWVLKYSRPWNKYRFLL